jgi:hypothetical protein
VDLEKVREMWTGIFWLRDDPVVGPCKHGRKFKILTVPKNAHF